MTPQEKAADARLQRLYGITLEQYELILEYQGGCCAICRRPAETSPTRLNVDHDHKTGVVRGLCCPACNRKVLHELRDNAATAARAAAYLIDPPAVRVIGAVVAPAQPAKRRRRRS